MASLALDDGLGCCTWLFVADLCASWFISATESSQRTRFAAGEHDSTFSSTGAPSVVCTMREFTALSYRQTRCPVDAKRPLLLASLIFEYFWAEACSGEGWGFCRRRAKTRPPLFVTCIHYVCDLRNVQVGDIGVMYLREGWCPMSSKVEKCIEGRTLQ